MCFCSEIAPTTLSGQTWGIVQSGSWHGATAQQCKRFIKCIHGSCKVKKDIYLGHLESHMKYFSWLWTFGLLWSSLILKFISKYEKMSSSPNDVLFLNHFPSTLSWPNNLSTYQFASKVLAMFLVRLNPLRHSAIFQQLTRSRTFIAQFSFPRLNSELSVYFVSLFQFFSLYIPW